MLKPGQAGPGTTDESGIGESGTFFSICGSLFLNLFFKNAQEDLLDLTEIRIATSKKDTGSARDLNLTLISRTW